jgi:hypothetical protein
MKTIKIRNIPPAVARTIRERASRESISTNRAVISFLQEATRTKRPRVAAPHQDLDDLAGTWSREESVEFERALRAQRTVDPKAAGRSPAQGRLTESVAAALAIEAQNWARRAAKRPAKK